jgi:hypothetical protein
MLTDRCEIYNEGRNVHPGAKSVKWQCTPLTLTLRGITARPRCRNAPVYSVAQVSEQG